VAKRQVFSAQRQELTIVATVNHRVMTGKIRRDLPWMFKYHYAIDSWAISRLPATGLFIFNVDAAGKTPERMIPEI
jgi:hypothetical protein